MVSAEDLSARGTNATPQALELDISTLKKGPYIVQLEIEVAGQYTVRAEHRIEIIGPEGQAIAHGLSARCLLRRA